MPQDDNLQVGVFYTRQPNLSTTGIPVLLGGGDGNLVRIWACHWNFEVVGVEPGEDKNSLYGVALSSDPEHELVPPVGFAGFQNHKALYARSLIAFHRDGIGDSSLWITQQIVPVYGLIRPRRQIAVIFLLSSAVEGETGIGLEVYYEPISAPLTEREEVNRKYGKYRRS